MALVTLDFNAVSYGAGSEFAFKNGNIQEDGFTVDNLQASGTQDFGTIRGGSYNDHDASDDVPFVTFDGGVGISKIRITKDDGKVFDAVSLQLESLGTGTGGMVVITGTKADFDNIVHVVQLDTLFSLETFVLPDGFRDLIALDIEGPTNFQFNDIVLRAYTFGPESADNISQVSAVDLAYKAQGGNDSVDFGAFYTPADFYDGGSGSDTVFLTGNYTTTMGFNGNIRNVETIRLQNGTHNLTLGEGLLGGGLVATINASTLLAGQSATVNGSGETDGLLIMIGSIGNDSFTGGGQNDQLSGGDGNDFLNGGGGVDTMTGGLGNDIFVVDNPMDTITELSGQGTDEVRTSLGDRSIGAPRYVLPANFENLTGILGSGQALEDNAVNNVITTGVGGDLIVARNGGNDTISTGNGADFVFFGSAFTALDSVNGGAGRDKIGLHGDYVIQLAAGSLSGVEKLLMYSSGNPANDFDYSISTHDANVAAGVQLEVTALSLMANETLGFDGSAETNGSFWVRSGAGNDTIIGGAGADRILGGLGADRLTGGGGADRFDMLSANHSTSTNFDTLVGFDASVDRINVSPAFGGWGGVASGAVSAATFDSQIAGLVNSLMGPNQAVKVNASSGDQAGKTFVVFDANGDGSYTAGQDLVWSFEAPVQTNLEAFLFFT